MRIEIKIEIEIEKKKKNLCMKNAHKMDMKKDIGITKKATKSIQKDPKVVKKV